jgi:hypothetical protein
MTNYSRTHVHTDTHARQSHSPSADTDRDTEMDTDTDRHTDQPQPQITQVRAEASGVCSHSFTTILLLFYYYFTTPPPVRAQRLQESRCGSCEKFLKINATVPFLHTFTTELTFQNFILRITYAFHTACHVYILYDISHAPFTLQTYITLYISCCILHVHFILQIRNYMYFISHVLCVTFHITHHIYPPTVIFRLVMFRITYCICTRILHVTYALLHITYYKCTPAYYMYTRTESLRPFQQG